MQAGLAWALNAIQRSLYLKSQWFSLECGRPLDSLYLDITECDKGCSGRVLCMGMAWRCKQQLRTKAVNNREPQNSGGLGRA